MTVGQKVSQADYYVNDYQEAVSTLIEVVLPAIEVRQSERLGSKMSADLHKWGR